MAAPTGSLVNAGGKVGGFGIEEKDASKVKEKKSGGIGDASLTSSITSMERDAGGRASNADKPAAKKNWFVRAWESFLSFWREVCAFFYPSKKKLQEKLPVVTADKLLEAFEELGMLGGDDNRAILAGIDKLPIKKTLKDTLKQDVTVKEFSEKCGAVIACIKYAIFVSKPSTQQAVKIITETQIHDKGGLVKQEAKQAVQEAIQYILDGLDVFECSEFAEAITKEVGGRVGSNGRTTVKDIATKLYPVTDAADESAYNNPITRYMVAQPGENVVSVFKGDMFKPVSHKNLMLGIEREINGQ